MIKKKGDIDKIIILFAYFISTFLILSYTNCPRSTINKNLLSPKLFCKQDNHTPSKPQQQTIEKKSHINIIPSEEEIQSLIFQIKLHYPFQKVSFDSFLEGSSALQKRLFPPALIIADKEKYVLRFMGNKNKGPFVFGLQ